MEKILLPAQDLTVENLKPLNSAERSTAGRHVIKCDIPIVFTIIFPGAL